MEGESVMCLTAVRVLNVNHNSVGTVTHRGSDADIGRHAVSSAGNILPVHIKRSSTRRNGSHNLLHSLIRAKLDIISQWAYRHRRDSRRTLHRDRIRGGAVRGGIRHHRDGVETMTKAGVDIGRILESRNSVPIVNGVVVPAVVVGGTLNRDGAVGIPVARHVGPLAQPDGCRQRIHIDGYRVCSLAAVPVGRSHDV